MSELPEGWVKASIEDVFQICDGARVPLNAKQRAQIKGGFPYYGANGQVDSINDFRYDGDYTLIAEDGGNFDQPERGVAYNVGGQFWVYNHAHVLKPRDGIAFAFGCYALNATDWMPHVGGSTRLKLTQGSLRKAEIPIPPLNEQRRIVAKLGACEARIGAAREALDEVPALLEQYRQSVLAAAFRGDLTRDWREKNPDVEPATELLARLRTERRHRWEQAELAKYQAKSKAPPKNWQAKYKEPETLCPRRIDELPKLPGGWSWVRWEEIGFCQNGRAFPSKEYAPSGTKLLRPGNLHVNGKMEWNEKNTRFMPNSWAEEYPLFIVREGELVMNLTAQSLEDEFLGRICLTGRTERCLLNQRLARLSPVGLDSVYTLFAFKSPVFRRYVDSLNTGTLIQHIFTSQILDGAFPLAPRNEQKEIARICVNASNLIEEWSLRIAESTEDLTTLTQSLLAKAFRGELVPQDPSDEPATVLLARLREERDARALRKEKAAGKKHFSKT